MSDYRMTMGWVAQLATPFSKSEYSLVNDDLYFRGTKLAITYGGELIYMTVFDEEIYNAGLMIPNMDDSVFRNMLIAEKIGIVGKPVFFAEVWYNCADSGISELTLKQLVEKQA